MLASAWRGWQPGDLERQRAMLGSIQGIMNLPVRIGLRVPGESLYTRDTVRLLLVAHCHPGRPL